MSSVEGKSALRPPAYPAARPFTRGSVAAACVRYGGVPLMVTSAFVAYVTLSTRQVPDVVTVLSALTGLAVVAVPLEVATGGFFRRSTARIVFDGVFTLLMIALEATVVTFAPRLVAPIAARTPFAAFWPKTLPFAAQLLLGLLLADFLAWVVHYLQHRREDSSLWRMHAVHHSIDSLDLIGGTRNHPYDVLTAATTSMSVLFLGAGSDVFCVVVMLNLFANTIHHVNVDLDVGPLGRVFVTPRAHAWHHGRGLPKGVNFGHVLSIWDTLFGTYYCPRPFEGAFGLDTTYEIPATVPAMLAAGASKNAYERHTRRPAAHEVPAVETFGT
jgi:sterol desaturase/sphingolipid hydroxylase (fatty acid hydroxylase superfamily)